MGRKSSKRKRFRCSDEHGSDDEHTGNKYQKLSNKAKQELPTNRDSSNGIGVSNGEAQSFIGGEFSLSANEIQRFQEKGFILLRQAFPTNLAVEAREFLWDYLKDNHGILKDDPKTWVERQGIPVCFQEGKPWSEILQSPKLNRAINQLCGGSWEKFGLGWWVINFPGFHLGPWGAAGRWHIDGSHYRHKLNSRESGLIPIFLFSSTVPEAGGTALCTGSHKIAAQVLRDVGANGCKGSALSHEVLRRIERNPGSMQVEQIVGSEGDVMFLHPLLLHARSKNLASRKESFVRFMCNPGVQLSREKNINVRRQSSGKVDHNDQQESPVERAIIDSLK